MSKVRMEGWLAKLERHKDPNHKMRRYYWSLEREVSVSDDEDWGFALTERAARRRLKRAIKRATPPEKEIIYEELLQL